MRYEFEAADGSRIEIDLPMHKAPPFGSQVKRGGKVYRRVPSIGGQVYVEPNRCTTIWSQHPDEVASPHRRTVEGVEFAVVTSKKQIEDTEARSGGEIRFGDGIHRVKGSTSWH